MIKTEKLSTLCDIKSGGTPSRKTKTFYGGNIPWVKIGDFDKSNGFITETTEYITIDGLKAIRNRTFPVGTLLFAMYGSVGKTAIAGVELSTNQAILGINVKVNKRDKLDINYLKKFLDSNIEFYKDRAVGGILKNLSATLVRDFDIPIPEITIQKRIAQVLSDCEGLIAKRKESIGLLDELVKSTFLEMFGDPRTNEMGWESDRVIEFANCIVPGRDKPKSFTGNIPWVTTNDLNHLGFTNISKDGIGLKEEEINQVRARTIPSGSVLMTCVGDLGVVSIAKQRMLVNQQLHSFQVLEGMNNIFLMYALSFQTSIMYKLASTTTVPYLNKTNCNAIPVIRPNLNLQEQFETVYLKIQETKDLFQSHLLELENLYARLSQDVFKGELDLSRVVLRKKVNDNSFTVAEENNTYSSKTILKNKEASINKQELLSLIKTYYSDEEFILQDLMKHIYKDLGDIDRNNINNLVKDLMNEKIIEENFSGTSRQIIFKLKNET